MLTDQEIKQIFINTHLEENYNFLEKDLIKLAKAYIAAAEKKIRDNERDQCTKIVRSLNREVARVLEQAK